MEKNVDMNTKAALSKGDYACLVAEEELILAAQVMVQRVLNERALSQKELADMLEVTQSYVSQMLNASARNLTLRTFARVAYILGLEATIALVDPHAVTDYAKEKPAPARQRSKATVVNLLDHRGAAWTDAPALTEPGRKRGEAKAYGRYEAQVHEIEPEIMALAA